MSWSRRLNVRIIIIIIRIITDNKRFTAGLHNLTNYTVKRNIKSVGRGTVW